MTELLIGLNVAVCVIAAICAWLAWRRAAAAEAALREATSREIQDAVERLRGIGDAQASGLRLELGGNLSRFQDSVQVLLSNFAETVALRVGEGASRLEAGVRAIDERMVAGAQRLDAQIEAMSEDSHRQRDELRLAIEQKLEAAAARQDRAAKEAREEITASFGGLGRSVRETLQDSTEKQKAELAQVSLALTTLTDKQEKAQESLRAGVEQRLDRIRDENTAKLDEMRQTVDEKLQSTLETRLTHSFQVVTDQLQKVSHGIGEMQQLASGVGDLKRVLTQVKPRGVWGEAQLGSLLEDFLSPDQFMRNVAVNPATQERVEFAIRLPRSSEAHAELLMPLDAKFPHESFERVVAASETADNVALEAALRELERVVRGRAREISSKYIVPPHTTDYAVMFVPSEALYAEIARRPGLVETLSRECAVMIAGPSTLIALLNAIRVGFRSAVIHHQAAEVSRLLQKVRAEFEKYGAAVNTVHNRATSTVRAIEALQTRQNVMGRALRGVDKMSADAAAAMIDMEIAELPGLQDDEARGKGYDAPLLTRPAAE